MTSKHALFPGTFDPMTYGHLDILARSLRLFERVTVAVAAGGRSTLFEHSTRLALAETAVAELSDSDRCQVMGFDGLLVDTFHELSADVIVRGVRGAADLEHEQPMAAMNHRLAPDFEALFLLARPELSMLSATIVRDVARCGGELHDLVPLGVASALREHFQD